MAMVCFGLLGIIHLKPSTTKLLILIIHFRDPKEASLMSTPTDLLHRLKYMGKKLNTCLILEYALKPYMHTSNKSKDNVNVLFNEMSNQNSWHDNECKVKNYDFKASKSLYLDTKNEVDFQNMCKIRNSYRKLCREKIHFQRGKRT